MTKQELTENYEMDDLADLVIEAHEQSESLRRKLLESQEEINKLDKREVYLQEDLLSLKSKLDQRETTINQIDDILEKLFDVTHDIVSKPDEFEKILTEKAEGYKTISDFLPEEPIEVASMLIKSMDERSKPHDGLIYLHYNISELRQIAEHLLVYCNANESEGEE